MNPIQFQITELRAKNHQTLLEMIGIVLFSLFFGAFAPSIIISLFFANAQLLEAPWFYQAIPVGALVLAILYTLYTLVTNLLRERIIRKLGMQAVNPVDSKVNLPEKEIRQLEKMVDNTLKSVQKKAQVVKAKTRTTAKRTSKK